MNGHKNKIDGWNIAYVFHYMSILMQLLLQLYWDFVTTMLWLVFTLLEICDTFAKIYNFHYITLLLEILSGLQIVQHGV
jgi:hypothetical protein